MKLLICLAAVLAVAVAHADDNATAGRDVLAKRQSAIVTVKIVSSLNMSFGGRDNKTETKSEASGTVIDPSGLTVISLSALDPASMVNHFMKSRAQGANAGMNFESQLTDIKLLLADGTEIPAEVLLRDKDLDLAYIRPKEKLPSTIVPLTLDPAVKPAVLDQVIVLNRLGQIANRVCAASITRIEALVEKPRPFYIVGQTGSASGLGSAVFNATGQLLGVVLMRMTNVENPLNIASAFANPSGLGLMPIIVPTADILDGAKQALAAKSTN